MDHTVSDAFHFRGAGLGALKEKEAKLEEASGGRWSLNNRVAFDEELKKLVKSSQQLLEESQTLKYGAEFIGSMVERGKQSQCCPTCDRGFQAQGELDALMAKLTKRREKNMGSKLKEVTQLPCVAQEKWTMRTKNQRR